MPPQLYDSQQKQGHGELGHGVSGNGKSVGDIGPKDGVGRAGEGQRPKGPTEAIVDSHLDSGGKDNKKEAGNGIEIVLSTDKTDNINAGIEAEGDEDDDEDRDDPHGHGKFYAGRHCELRSSEELNLVWLIEDSPS